LGADKLHDADHSIKKSIIDDNSKDDEKGFPVLVHFLSLPKEEAGKDNKANTDACSRSAGINKAESSKDSENK